MKYMNHLALAGALLSALAMPLQASAQPKVVRPAVVPLTSSELTSIYGGRTWIWNSGGGRFENSRNQFSAYTREAGKSSVGQGRWAVDENGKLCIFAKWHASDGAARAATCFGHVKVGDTIYQRRYPFGHWYVFRHARVRQGDEFRKLVAADTVTPKVRQWQASVSRNDNRN